MIRHKCGANDVHSHEGHQRNFQIFGLGAKTRFWYGHRPKDDKEDAYRDTDLGIMIELYKQFTSMHAWKLKNTATEGEQLQQHIAHMEHMVSEISRLTPKLPTHKHMGVSEADKLRFIAAAQHARNFSVQQLQKIIAKSQSYINFKLAAQTQRRLQSGG